MLDTLCASFHFRAKLWELLLCPPGLQIKMTEAQRGWDLSRVSLLESSRVRVQIQVPSILNYFLEFRPGESGGVPDINDIILKGVLPQWPGGQDWDPKQVEPGWFSLRCLMIGTTLWEPGCEGDRKEQATVMAQKTSTERLLCAVQAL